MIRKQVLIWGSLILLLLVGVPFASAQTGGEVLPEGVTGDDVYRVSNQMYCDVCAGIPLSTCASPTCFRWRQEIANLLGEGKTDEEIYTYFATNYGEDVTGVPLSDSNRGLALGLPIFLTLVIGGGVGWQIWRIYQKQEPRAAKAAKAAGLREDYIRPVPDNVDSEALATFMRLVEEKN